MCIINWSWKGKVCLFHLRSQIWKLKFYQTYYSRTPARPSRNSTRNAVCGLYVVHFYYTAPTLLEREKVKGKKPKPSIIQLFRIITLTFANHSPSYFILNLYNKCICLEMVTLHVVLLASYHTVEDDVFLLHVKTPEGQWEKVTWG